MMSTFLYVGAGTDLRIALRIAQPDQHLLLVDSQPFSEYGKVLAGQTRPDGSDVFSRPKFAQTLRNALRRRGLTIDRDTSLVDRWACTRAHRSMLTYLLSTAVPEDGTRLENEETLRETTTLLVRGYHPHRALLALLPNRPLRFIGTSGTCYGLDETEDHTLVYALHTEANARARFASYVYMDLERDTVVEYDTWAGFACRHAPRPGI